MTASSRARWALATGVALGLAGGLPALAAAIPTLPRPVVKPTGVEVRQAGGSGPEPLIATFKKARCTLLRGDSFRIGARSTNGRFRLVVIIPDDVWRGFGGGPYTLLRRDDELNSSQVAVYSPRGVYDSHVAVPGFPAAGAVLFADDGSAVSVGGVFFLRGDMSQGISVSGAVACPAPKRKRR